MSTVETVAPDPFAPRAVRRGQARRSIGMLAILLALTLWSSVFQLYVIPIDSYYLSITFVASLMLVPFEYKALLGLTPFSPILFLYGLLAVYIVSLAWAVQIVAGLNTIAFTLPFITVFYASYLLSIRRPAQFRFIIHFFFLITLVQAFLTIGFRIVPSVKDSFVSSSLITPFIGENEKESIDSGVYILNVADPDKSGGLFVNANVAAAYMGICSLLAWGFGVNSRKPYLKVTAVILGVAVLFTGSKAGILLGVGLGGAAFFAEGFVARMNSRFALFILALAGVVAFAVNYLPDWESHTRLSGFFSDAGSTATSRTVMWSFAGTQFAKHPLKGLGFGGWEDAFYYPSLSLGLRGVLPPHNTYILLWSNSGLAAVLFGFGFAFTALAFQARCLFSSDRALTTQTIYTLAAFLWLVLHGLGENFGLLGDMHILIILAAALGALYASYDMLGVVDASNNDLT